MDSRVEQLLRADPANAAGLADSLNRHLQRVSEAAGASDVYLMDATGLTIAASNWDSESPFIGSNFAFRPYFKDAAAGRPGHYFALGTASNKRGYYYSAPVPGADGIAGVVAVKVSLGDLEASWSRSSEHLLVTDPDGVIFIASDRRWRFRSLERLDYSVLERIRDSRRYPEVAIEPLPVSARWGAAGGTRLLRLKTSTSEAPRSGFMDVMTQSRPMADVGWTVHLLSEIAPLRHRVVVAVLTAGLAAVVLLLVALFALQRRDHARERVAMQRRAHEQLEGLVAERTLALVQSNEQLAHEIAERTETEHALRSTQDELVQAGKLAALGQMAAEIAHELNQPLAAIRGYADNARTLLERARTAEVGSNLSLIGELTTRMATITGQLKTFARKSSGEPAEVAVAAVLDEALGLLGPRLHRAGITLTRAKRPTGGSRAGRRGAPGAGDREPGPERHGRHAGCASEAPGRGGQGHRRRRSHPGPGQRQGYRRTGTAKAVRALFHHQGDWQRTGPRAVHLLRHREGSRRFGGSGQPRRRRCRVPGDAAPGRQRDGEGGVSEPRPVIFVDDEEHVRMAARQTLELEGFQVTCRDGAHGVPDLVSPRWPGVLITDVRMPGTDGMTLLRQVAQVDADIPVVLITGHGEIAMAVEAMREGAYDFIEKPFPSQLLVDVVRRAMEKRSLVLENRDLRATISGHRGLEATIVGRAPCMARLRQSIEAVASTDADVLISGESGTGKELVARGVHEHSHARTAPFVAVNCGALPESLLESELFGHEQGAFTGAVEDARGHVRAGRRRHAVPRRDRRACPWRCRCKLLRVLQERSVSGRRRHRDRRASTCA